MSSGKQDANGTVKHRRKAAETPTTPSVSGQLMAESGPALLAATAILALIFGGCCSNVFALEAIVNFGPASGTLLTFVQFAFVAVIGFAAQFDRTRPPFFVTPNKVPISRWLVNIVLFFSINMLNNHAFSYDISVPVHIILRSGGSITTMAIGYLYGKRYSRIQVVSVVLLTFGIIMAAWSDAQSKGQASSDPQRPAFSTGLVILFVAQLLSAFMGLYTDIIYEKYGPQWKENLFYTHVLSLPFFIPFAPAMLQNLRHLAESAPLDLPGPLRNISGIDRLPRQLVYLVANVLTQYACIRGVNLLAATTSSLTVTIVLSIRKLASLLLSIWLFGNTLASGTLIGAVIVFGAGGLYSLDSKPKSKKKKEL
ncbi:UAA transporter [Stachybotrys elegans]|uniref:UAA transporter n=1 Tax=Stachybotrys elegans TaxID=80388 RepID=A0A8K0T5D3_9HYPO|nr:UAA transporter [Stachybotrys elegans]